MLRSIAARLWLFALLALLAACGSASAPQAAAPTPLRAKATAAPAPTAGQLATPAGVPEGLTPEGYHVRGKADAPVTLTMYSDFL